MKRILIFMLFLPTMVFAQQPHSRVMTFNVRFDNPKDGENSWSNRKEIVADVIHYHHPQIFGLQEALHHQVFDLDSLLPNYHWIGVGRDDGKESGEYNPIFYQHKKYKILRNGTFWLSENPNNPGKGWDAACNRIVTWAQFLEKESGIIFYFFNTHLDHQGTIARIESTNLLIRKINTLISDNPWIPIIITGDFNCLMNSGPYQLMTYWDNPLKMKDTQIQAGSNILGPNSTYNGFENPCRDGLIIDYIFVNQKVEVHHHQIISDQKGNQYPSDHFPVVAEISLMK